MTGVQTCALPIYRGERLKKIADEIDAIIRDIGPKWIKLAHLRKEAGCIIEELSGDKGK